MNNRNKLSLLAGVILVAGAAAQEPQGFVGGEASNLGDLIAPKSPGFSQKFGVADVKGELRLYGKAGLETGSSGDGNSRELLADEQKGKSPAKLAALGGLAADVFFFGAQREVAAVELKYEVELGASAAEVTSRTRSNAVATKAEAGIPQLSKSLRLCGFTIRLEKQDPSTPTGWCQDGTGQSSAKGSKLGPKNLLPRGVSAQVMVGPVPLLIRANAGAGIEFGAAPFVDAVEGDGGRGVQLGLEGMVGAYLSGWVTAGVGGGCKLASACAGVKAELRLMDTSAGLRLGWDTRTGLLAQLRYKLEAAVLTIRAIAYCELWLGVVRISKSFEHLLFQWSAPAIEGTIPPNDG